MQGEDPTDDASTPRPILDHDHLDRQTFGDAALEREVLLLFRDQLQSAIADFAHAPMQDRPGLLHRLKGAARGVGAFDFADKAEKLERHLDTRLLDEVEAAAAVALAAVESRLTAGVSHR